MGLEARCRCRFGKQVSEGKVHLDSDHLLFRGAFRLKIPFQEMKSVKSADGCLTITLHEGTATLELGPAAAKWADKILNPPERLDKLGVKPGMRVVILHVDDPAFHEEVKARQTSVFTRSRKDADLIFLGAGEQAELKSLAALVASLKPAGAVWVIYPKGVKQITQADVMSAGKTAGLVDTKVASFTATHTALKLMIPVANRRI